MKSHPLFAWFGQDPGQIPLARLNAYCTVLGFDARIVTHHAPRGVEQPLWAFLQAALTLFDRAHIERELGAGYVPAVAFLTPNQRAGFLFVRPTTAAAVALWAIGLADLANPLPVRQRLSELCAPTLTPIALYAGEPTQRLAEAELSRLDGPTLQGALDLLIDGLQLHAHGLPGLMFDPGEGRL